ncbi:hypothetical protein B0T44_15085 [Nocardia donostiensis]|uniref:HTH luxR-type domain-containing protein n=1 Tax=Nocardia donostiensis TaxID=1538463 RepID=A0A1V2TB33_9NOCA|nr:hypothetical protein B0T46_21850 [Nocardia donostiensis]OQS19339.1 hypothetical protein B0T44_15085 [Nocardia donostiensis]
MPGRCSRTQATTAGLHGLTERQTEIINRVVLGRTKRRISAELYLSEKTIETHLSRLFTKLRVSSRAELAALATVDQAQRRT